LEWITTDDVQAEAWRRLSEYANTDLTYEAIAAIHGPPSNTNHRKNYEKQATQIRAAILQAREYFDASKNASLYTKPNHLYYGMVSLATAIMLLRGDGNKSLDKLRLNSNNLRHGLTFSTGVTKSTCGEGLTLLENSYTEILPNGFFMNWYSTLPNRENVYAVHEHKFGSVTRKSRIQIGDENIILPQNIPHNKYNLMELLIRLPDLLTHLGHYGIMVSASRMGYEVYSSEKKVRYRWRIHSAPSHNHLEEILFAFKSGLNITNNWQWSDMDNMTGCVIDLIVDNDVKHHFEYPSIRENLNYEQIAYANALDTPEIVDIFIIGYVLSMLARYYPDYWIGCIESHCKAAAIIERLMFVNERKFPILALKYLSSKNIVISIHLPPWQK
jgi:hypothetical protein